jgi:5-methylcytosine-specific restriction endonuclease McrA
MPYVNKPRPYKKEYQQQKERGEHPLRMERQKARRAMDKDGKDENGNGKADSREGKDIDHIKPLSKGGSNNKNNLRVVSPSTNRSKKNK